MEFLCHDISVHVPHHVSAKIPWYNLRAANESLRQKWGQVRRACHHEKCCSLESEALLFRGSRVPPCST